MSLIVSAQALNDTQFRDRVGAAVLQYASGNLATLTDESDKLYAHYVINNPTSVDGTMVALVAANPVIAAAFKFDSYGRFDSSGVSDGDIEYMVSQSFHQVALKYMPQEVQPTVLETLLERISNLENILDGGTTETLERDIEGLTTRVVALESATVDLPTLITRVEALEASQAPAGAEEGEPTA